MKFKTPKNIINNSRLQTLISLGNEETSDFLLDYYLEGANFGALRKAEKHWDSTINDYFKKIKNGYIPWKVWSYF